MNDPITTVGYKDYGFHQASPSHMHRHFLPPIFDLCGPLHAGMRVLDVGCGNGFTVGEFLKRGCSVVGLDLSESGIKLARQTYPGARFEVLAAVHRGDSEVPGTVRRVRVGELSAGTEWGHALFGVRVVVHTAARVHVLTFP